MVVATIDTDDYLTPDEAADLLNAGLPKKQRLSAHTLRRYFLNYVHNEENGLLGDDRETPEIPARRMGRSWQIHRQDILDYKKNRKQRGRPVTQSNS